MTAFLSITFIVALLSIALFQMFRNRRTTGYIDVKSVVMPRILCALVVMSICGILCDRTDSFRLLLDSVLAVVAISPLVLSVRPVGRLPLHVGSVPIVIPVAALYYLLVAVGVLNTFSSSVLLVLSGLGAFLFPFFFIWMIWRRLRDVKSVMKSGHVWSFVTLCVDFIYVMSPLLMLSVLYFIYILFPGIAEEVVFVAVFLFLLEIVAVAIRISYDSAFVVMHDHERVIVESMKVAHMEMSSTSDPRGEEMYKELYERIVLYFEMSKPYLDGDLTINDVVKVVYSNKVYISKAICHYTGRNFRQFVNYYRIMYSMQLFRDNLELKVTELAEKSGFNTVVSYTMAFRLFMNETPSEWCRKERSKILKQKK